MSTFELVSVILAIIAIIVSLFSILFVVKSNRFSEIKHLIDKIFFADDVYKLIERCSYGGDISKVCTTDMEIDRLFSCLNYVCSFAPLSFIGRKLRKEYAYILKIPVKSDDLMRRLCYFRYISKAQFPNDEFLYKHYIDYLFCYGLLNEDLANEYAKSEENARTSFAIRK